MSRMDADQQIDDEDTSHRKNSTGAPKEMTILVRCRMIPGGCGGLIGGCKRGRGDSTRLLRYGRRMDFEEGGVSALWDRHANGLVDALFAEVLFEPLAKAAGMGAHDTVDGRVIVGRAL